MAPKCIWDVSDKWGTQVRGMRLVNLRGVFAPGSLDAGYWKVCKFAQRRRKKHRIPPGEGCETFTLMGSADPVN
jgi:hypothetical protein